MNRIVVIGSCNMDVTVLSDKRPNPGETVIGKGLHITHGGKGANQAVAASRAGAEVTMVGCIGNDAYGQMVLHNLKANQVNTDYVVTIPDVPTGTAHITLADGDNSIIVVPGANAKVDPAVVDAAWSVIEQADLVMIQNEIPMRTNAYILQHCYEANVPVLLNPAPSAPLGSNWLDYATYITPNEHELGQLYKNQDRDTVLKTYANKVIVTLGKDGVAYADDEGVHTIPGFAVEPVDTTGAGDTFNGAFATAIVNGKSLSDALFYGNAAAALSIQSLGAQAGMPTKDEVALFLATVRS